jgi:hypothetical protein
VKAFVVLLASLPLAGCDLIVGIDDREAHGGVGAGEPMSCESAATEPYRETVLADEPVLYWPLDDPPGALEAEALVGPNGTITGAILGEPGAVEGSVGSARLGEGTIHLAHDRVEGFAGDEAWSLELWFWGEGHSDAQPTQYLVRKFEASSLDPKDHHGYIVWIYRENNQPFAFARASLIEKGILWRDASAGVPVTKRWHHLVVVFNPSVTTTLSIYLDGELRGQGPSYGKADNDAPFVIGGHDPDNPSFLGLVDEVAAYDRALDCRDVARHYAAGS